MSRLEGTGRGPLLSLCGVGGQGSDRSDCVFYPVGAGTGSALLVAPQPLGAGDPLPGSGQLRPRQAHGRRTPGWGRAGWFLLPVRVAASALGLREAAEPKEETRRGSSGWGTQVIELLVTDMSTALSPRPLPHASPFVGTCIGSPVCHGVCLLPRHRRGSCCGPDRWCGLLPPSPQRC